MLLADSAREELQIGLRRGRAPGPEPEELLSALGLEGVADRPPSLLSSGETRRLALAAALVGGPDLLIIDEPAAGQHPQAREAMMSLARRPCGQGGALLFITHDVELVRRWADRIVVLREGEMAAQGSPLRANEANCLEDA